SDARAQRAGRELEPLRALALPARARRGLARRGGELRVDRGDPRRRLLPARRGQPPAVRAAPHRARRPRGAKALQARARALLDRRRRRRDVDRAAAAAERRRGRRLRGDRRIGPRRLALRRGGRADHKPLRRPLRARRLRLHVALRSRARRVDDAGAPLRGGPASDGARHADAPAHADRVAHGPGARSLRGGGRMRRGLSSVALAIALALAIAGACTQRAAGVPIELGRALEGAGPRSVVTASGWEVELSEARALVGPIYAYAPSGASALRLALGPPRAFAHGGTHPLDGRVVRAELLELAVLDALAAPSDAAILDGLAGEVDALTIVLAGPEDAAREAATHGHAVWVAGVARRDGVEVAFEGGLD